MIKQSSNNSFNDGLVMDLNPLLTPNNVMTGCLNGTLITFNGNEYTLQNDMGNCRVETAMLPTGYIPLGTTSFGGIIYIVSYNPIDKKYQIGSFPSPERNLIKEELGDVSNKFINIRNFFSNYTSFVNYRNIITNYYQKIDLSKSLIFPGDQYKIFSTDIHKYFDYISAYDEKNTQKVDSYPKYIRFDIIATLDNGKTINLTENSVWTPEPNNDSTYFYIKSEEIKLETGKFDLKEQRGLVGSNYDTFQSKLSGKLGIAARLEVPTSFSVGYEVLVKDADTKEAQASTNTKYQLYYYLNWANDNVGEHKNRINPSTIKTTYNGTSTYQKIELVNKQGSKVKPNATDNYDYYTPDTPDNFYKDFNLEDYLEDPEKQFEKTVLRKNDGSDFQYKLEGPIIEISRDTEGKTSIKSVTLPTSTYSTAQYKSAKETLESNNTVIKLDITPCMPFGELQFLKRTLSIDVSKLLTGEINLFNYQYYIEDNKVSMDFFIEAYPELGRSITGGEINFYPLSSYISADTWKMQSTYDNQKGDKKGLLSNPTYTHTIDTPFNGQKSISFERSSTATNFLDDNIYIAEFKLIYGTQERYFYRIFFNSKIFNNAYGTGQDFKDLYLYDKDQNYGLVPTIDFINDVDSTTEDISTEVIPKYKQQRSREKFIRDYKVTQKINSAFTISTALDGIVVLSLSNITSKECTAIPRLSDERMKSQEKMNVTPIITDSTISINNPFIVKIPYNVEYAKAESLYEYILSTLTDGAANHKIILQHFSLRAENEGYFAMFRNNTGDITTDSDIIEQWESPDKSRNVSIYIDSVQAELEKIMDDFKYDYITIIFGIAYIHDNDCGYGYRNLDSGGRYEYFYKLGGKHKNMFTKMTCIRNADSAVIAHAKNAKLIQCQHPEKGHYKSFNHLYNQLVTGDGSLIPNLYGSYNSLYYKYKKTGLTQVLYYISDFDYISDPTIDVDYNFTLKGTVGLSIYNTTINQNTEGLAKNLKIKNLDNFGTSVTLRSIIDNFDYAQDYLTLDTESRGWNIVSKSIITNKELEQVYKLQNGKYIVVPDLIINKDGLVQLSEEFNSKGNLVQWYFGWEYTGGDAGKSISYDNFAKSGQYYKVLYTYATPNITTQESKGNKFLWYDTTSDSEKYIKGQPYTLKVERVSTPDPFTECDIVIECINGSLGQDNFHDMAKKDEPFETTITVYPMENPCTVTLKKGNDMVGQYIFDNIQESDGGGTESETDSGSSN